MKNRREIGKKYEKKAELYLKQHNWNILEKNFYFQHKEIDIIAEKDGEICFIEVKYRKSEQFGAPEEFVNQNKINNIKKAALYYLQIKKYFDKNITFGIISITEEKIIFKRGFFEW